MNRMDTAVLAVRPQPLGAFPLPLGYLLIPASPETEAARLALARVEHRLVEPRLE